MDGEKTENNQPPVVSNPPPYAYYPAEDEISLADLWGVLVKRRKVLLAVTAMVTIGTVLYALLATPVYRAEVVFLPPTANNIQALHIEGVNKININSVYTAFELNLSSRPPRQTIYDQMNLLDQFAQDKDQDTSPGLIFDDFNQSLSVTTPKVKVGETAIPTITFAMEWEDPVLIAEIVNRIANEAERATTLEIILDFQAMVAARKKYLSQEIQLLREKAQIQRQDEIERLQTADVLARKTINDTIISLQNRAHGERIDRIARLKEASEIAHTLEIRNGRGYELSNISGETAGEPQTLIANNARPLYLRGYEALDAEIISLSNRTVDDPFIPERRGLQEELKLMEHNRIVEQLKSRVNDDPFIEPLRDKQIELARLESINIDPKTVTTAKLDQAAYPPDKRIKPNRKLIVVLGFMLGLMLGVFAAFFVDFLENQRKLPAAV